MENKNIWILAAHGSRIEAANQEVRALAASLAEAASQTVIPAFLEMADPDIPTAIERAAADRPEQIFILPYFLTQGRHVQEDIPKIVAAKARDIAPIRIRLLPYLGQSSNWVEIVRQLIREK